MQLSNESGHGRERIRKKVSGRRSPAFISNSNHREHNMCRQCFVHGTRQLLEIISSLPENERLSAASFLVEMTSELVDHKFDIEALDRTVNAEAGIIGHA